MKIKLISKEQYKELKTIQSQHPLLTFQNNGYEYIDKSRLSEADIRAMGKVSAVLAAHVAGFREFNNFQICKKTDKVRIRLQYNWNHDTEGLPFTGVGYLYLSELHHGFKS